MYMNEPVLDGVCMGAVCVCVCVCTERQLSKRARSETDSPLAVQGVVGGGGAPGLVVVLVGQAAVCPAPGIQEGEHAWCTGRVPLAGVDDWRQRVTVHSHDKNRQSDCFRCVQQHGDQNTDETGSSI